MNWWKIAFLWLSVIVFLAGVWAVTAHHNAIEKLTDQRDGHMHAEDALRVQVKDLQGQVQTLQQQGVAVAIPTCPVAAIVPRFGSKPRTWGNAVEVDYQGEATVFYCQPTTPSPSENTLTVAVPKGL